MGAFLVAGKVGAVAVAGRVLVPPLPPGLPVFLVSLVLLAVLVAVVAVGRVAPPSAQINLASLVTRRSLSVKPWVSRLVVPLQVPSPRGL